MCGGNFRGNQCPHRRHGFQAVRGQVQLVNKSVAAMQMAVYITTATGSATEQLGLHPGVRKQSKSESCTARPIRASGAGRAAADTKQVSAPRLAAG